MQTSNLPRLIACSLLSKCGCHATERSRFKADSRPIPPNRAAHNELKKQIAGGDTSACPDLGRIGKGAHALAGAGPRPSRKVVGDLHMAGELGTTGVSAVGRPLRRCSIPILVCDGHDGSGTPMFTPFSPTSLEWPKAAFADPLNPRRSRCRMMSWLHSG